MEKLIEPDDPEAVKTDEPDDAEPRAASRDTSGSHSNWPLHAALILVAAGLIVGLVFLARWIYHATKHTSGTHPPSTSQSQNKAAGKGGLSVTSGSGSHNGSSISLPGGTENNPPRNKTEAGKSTTLPNNGPGNVIGVFAVASFAAGALHYIVQLRRSNKAIDNRQ